MDSVTFVATRRNGRALCFGGFFYHINKSVDERSYWKCRTKGCKSTVVTINDIISSSSGQHHHEPNDSRVVATEDNSPTLNPKSSQKSTPKTTVFTKQLLPIVPQINCHKKQRINEFSNNSKKFKSVNNNRSLNQNYGSNHVINDYNNGFPLITQNMNSEAMDPFVDHLNVEIEVNESGRVKLEDMNETYDNSSELLSETSVPNAIQLMPNIDIKPNSIYFTNSYTNIEHFDIEMNNLFEVVRQSGFNSLDIQQISNDWELWKKRYLELKRARNRAKQSTTNGCNDRTNGDLKLQLEIAINAKDNAERELKRVQNSLKESQNNVLALRSVLRKNLLNGSNNQTIVLVNEINELKRKVSAQVESHQSNLNEMKRLLCLDDNDLRAEFDQLAQERDEALKDNFELRQEIIIIKSQLSSYEDKTI